MTILKFRAAALVMSCAALLSACGGGGGDAGTPPWGGGNNGGGGETPATTVSQLRMTLSNAVVANGDMSNVVATVTTLNANSQAISGATIDYRVEDQSANSEDGGAFILSAASTSNESGQGTATVNLGSDKANRVITVIASSGGQTISKTITLRGTVISATPELLVDPGTSKTIDFAVTDSNNAPIRNALIVVEGSGLGTRSGVTDSSGVYAYTYTVPNSPGNTLVFNVSAGGVSKQFSVSVKAPAQVLPPPDLSNGLTPALQANPNVVAVNADGLSTNRLQVVAAFEDLAGRPIPNMRVVFKLEGTTAATVGGAFSSGPISGTPVQTSGADGKVQTFYIPGTRSSPNNAISVRACYGSTDAEAQACASSATSGLLSQPITIADEAVSVTIGTDGLLINELETLSYAQRFIIKVVNSAGQPKAGLTVSAQINTVDYAKGQYEWDPLDSEWKLDPDEGFGAFGLCSKEDLDDDDRLDIGEDVDHDGRLEPIRADVSLIAPNGWVTNAEGVVVIKMSYPKNVASWMRVNIVATSLVGGSEGRASRQQFLNPLKTDIDNEASPAFESSPYGIVTGSVTVDAGGRTLPDGTFVPAGTVLTRCQNPD
jgi:hypothetical protein